MQINEVMRAAGLATIVEAGEGCVLKKDDIVYCTCGTFVFLLPRRYSTYLRVLSKPPTGWAEYAIIPEKDAKKVE